MIPYPQGESKAVSAKAVSFGAGGGVGSGVETGATFWGVGGGGGTDRSVCVAVSAAVSDGRTVNVFWGKMATSVVPVRVLNHGTRISGIVMVPAAVGTNTKAVSDTPTMSLVSVCTVLRLSGLG